MGFNQRVKGKLIFDPDNKTTKHRNQSVWKKTAVAIIDTGEMARYYAWFIKKRYDIGLSKPLRGTHLTVISDRFKYGVLFDLAKSKYNGKWIHIEYDTDVRTDGTHYWLNARCAEAKEIRETADLDPKPYFGFHITIGIVHERDIEHSKYIHRMIKNFGK